MPAALGPLIRCNLKKSTLTDVVRIVPRISITCPPMKLDALHWPQYELGWTSHNSFVPPKPSAMAKAKRSLNKYFLLETQDFSREGTVPKTSYLRLGAVAQPALMDSYAVMSACTPDAGAITMKSGAGEDLASRLFPPEVEGEATSGDQAAQTATSNPAAAQVVTVGFSDDTRKRCLTPVLDQAAADKDAANRVALLSKQAELEEAKMRLASTQFMLQRVLAAPHVWLRDMRSRKNASARRIAELERQVASATAAASSDTPASPEALSSKQYCADYQTKATRQAESAKLHVKGGWRDHTDGNRIVTTRRDKLEEIRGNYRKVVLGHTLLPKDALNVAVDPGWDLSGGHILEYGTTVSQITDIKWTQRHNGTWFATEQTWKTDTEAKTTGDVDSTAFGHMHLSVTGSDKMYVGANQVQGFHTAEDCPGGACHINPKVENKTWATESISSSGSAARPVPLHETHSWIDTSNSDLHVGTMIDSTTVSGAMETHTDVSGGAQTDNVTATTMTSSTTAANMTTTNFAGLIASSSHGSTTSFTRGISTSLSIGVHGEVSVGASFDMSAAASASLTVGKTTDVFLGVQYDLSMSPSLEMALGATIKTGSAAQLNVALLTFCKFTPIQLIKAVTTQL